MKGQQKRTKTGSAEESEESDCWGLITELQGTYKKVNRRKGVYLDDMEIIRCVCGKYQYNESKVAAGTQWIQCNFCRCWLHLKCCKMETVPNVYICPYCPDWNIPSDDKVSSKAYDLDWSFDMTWELGDYYRKDYFPALARFRELNSIPPEKFTPENAQEGVDILIKWGWYYTRESIDQHMASPLYFGPFMARHLDDQDTDGIEIGCGEGELTTFIGRHLRAGAEIYGHKLARAKRILSETYTDLELWNTDCLSFDFFTRILENPPSFFCGNPPFGPCLSLVWVCVKALEKRLYLMRKEQNPGRIPFMLLYLPTTVFDDSKYRQPFLQLMNMHMAAMHGVTRSSFGEYGFNQLKPTPDSLWLLRVGRRDALKSPISFVNLRNWAVPGFSASEVKMLDIREGRQEIEYEKAGLEEEVTEPIPSQEQKEELKVINEYESNYAVIRESLGLRSGVKRADYKHSIERIIGQHNEPPAVGDEINEINLLKYSERLFKGPRNVTPKIFDVLPFASKMSKPVPTENTTAVSTQVLIDRIQAEMKPKLKKRKRRRRKKKILDTTVDPVARAEATIKRTGENRSLMREAKGLRAGGNVFYGNDFGVKKKN